ncbi:MAG: LysM peptidoglycan-binding domain-containing protein [bacterium]
MRRNGFIIICGLIFYLFVTFNYPFLDLLINQAKAASSTLDNHNELRCEDLFLSYTIKTHNWNVSSPKLPPCASTKVNSTKPTQKKFCVTHVVKAGDTLWKISQKYGVDISTICRLNGLKRDTLSVGMKLKME